MTASISRLTLGATLALFAALDGGAAAPAAITDKAPDLAPIASRMEHGTVSVRNVGSADAGPFVVTVVCTNQGKGGCAESRGMTAYENAAYPNAVVVEVPGLERGKVFNHKLAFWDGLVWASGNYHFDVTVDAGTDVAETNEGNNDDTFVMNVP